MARRQWLSRRPIPRSPHRSRTAAKQSPLSAEESFSRSVVAATTAAARRASASTRQANEEAITTAWKSLGESPCVAEQALDLDYEISVMAARNPSGEVRTYPAARNHHENQILAWSVLPAGIPAEIESRAESLAAAMIAKLNLEGLLCVELFVTRQGELFVNELAPRPHNSYHQSERGCVTSQFEQLVRTTCNLPLGDTSLISPAPSSTCSAKSGSARQQRTQLRRRSRRARRPPASLRKTHPAPRPQNGPLVSVGATAEEALERVLEAKRRLL